MGGLLAPSIPSEARVDGKTIIITGANSGIGLETAADLYRRGGRVILLCRNLMKAEIGKKDIISRYLGYDGAGYVSIVKCDLSSLSSVRECAKEILKNEPRIDILINNAGVLMLPYELTEDGYEMQFATNHLGHFLLTMLLLPRILRGAEIRPSADPARIINLSSIAHKFTTEMHFEDINLRNNYGPKTAYYRSKAANVFFTKSLAARLEGKNVKVYAVHPGIVDTSIWRHSDSGCIPGATCFMKNIAPIFIKSSVQGAQTTLHCALTQEAASETGLYYKDCKKAGTSDFVKNKEVAETLFKISIAMTKLDFSKNDPFIAETEDGLERGVALHSL